MAKFPLQRLVDLAKDQTEAAIRALGDLNRQHGAIGGKLELLLQYRDEYRKKYEDAMRKGITQNELQNFRNFISRLDEAIDQQKRLLEQSARAVEEGRSRYREQHRKLKSFETLAARHEASESLKSARMEQKDLDEISSNAYSRKGSEDG